MTDNTEHTITHLGAAPAGITLEDFIEAAARGITQSLASQDDDVSGYRFGSEVTSSIAIGYVINCRPPADLGPRAPIVQSLAERAQR